MEDGLYIVDFQGICAGFAIRDGKVAECAPILRKRIELWKKIAKKVDATPAKP
jgi:hypothetical protein